MRILGWTPAKFGRDSALFVIGLAGVAHQAQWFEFWRASETNQALVVLFGGMMLSPVVIHNDERTAKKEVKDEQPTRSKPATDPTQDQGEVQGN